LTAAAVRRRHSPAKKYKTSGGGAQYRCFVRSTPPPDVVGRWGGHVRLLFPNRSGFSWFFSPEIQPK